ncbi:hypothetical protein M422DRAFT_277197 [Sphaerobolus stellatus SS14]|uniref:Uncharacterized protein n=1 Tax=Sphaerobolus stellatus (strain SS14) TaxID=990650 RepID=A0A0C9TKL1_SPHS4|nr:hypothetical protein M422DRAFT_277197 [Sphaerobolus stellatus SS14]
MSGLEWVGGKWRYDPDSFRKDVKEMFRLRPKQDFTELMHIGETLGIMADIFWDCQC